MAEHCAMCANWAKVRVAHYEREGRQAAVSAYERLVIDAAITWADLSPWSIEGIRAAYQVRTLTAALVAERRGLEEVG